MHANRRQIEGLKSQVVGKVAELAGAKLQADQFFREFNVLDDQMQGPFFSFPLKNLLPDLTGDIVKCIYYEIYLFILFIQK